LAKDKIATKTVNAASSLVHGHKLFIIWVEPGTSRIMRAFNTGALRVQPTIDAQLSSVSERTLPLTAVPRFENLRLPH
jgi:hypothetical protein